MPGIMAWNSIRMRRCNGPPYAAADPVAWHGNMWWNWQAERASESRHPLVALFRARKSSALIMTKPLIISITKRRILHEPLPILAPVGQEQEADLPYNH